MSIEQILADALADLREAVADGEAQDDAIASLAIDYGIKPNVLRARAEKAFGDLALLQSRICLERLQGRRTSNVHAAIISFCDQYIGAKSQVSLCPDARSWVENRLGFPLNDSEQAMLQEKQQDAFHRSQMRILDRLMKNAQN